jgi:hypothetical protein
LDKYIRPSIQSDVEYLAVRLRHADVEELAASGWTPYDSLSYGLHKGRVCFTMLDPCGLPLGMVGVCPSHEFEDFGVVWLLGTDEIATHQKRFLRQSRPVLAELYQLTGYRAFYNRTYYKNKLHHRWLKWLGFTFINTIGDFHTFVRIKDTCVDQ